MGEVLWERLKKYEERGMCGSTPGNRIEGKGTKSVYNTYLK